MNVLDYQYEFNRKSDSDGLTASISPSYLLILVALVAMTIAFYVFCISEKQIRHHNVNPKYQTSDLKLDEKHQKSIYHSKIDSEIV